MLTDIILLLSVHGELTLLNHWAPNLVAETKQRRGQSFIRSKRNIKRRNLKSLHPPIPDNYNYSLGCSISLLIATGPHHPHPPLAKDKMDASHNEYNGASLSRIPLAKCPDQRDVLCFRSMLVHSSAGTTSSVLLIREVSLFQEYACTQLCCSVLLIRGVS